MKLRFTKMHGVGNDFVVLDGVSQRVALDQAALRRLADRHFGVGCDQILVVERPRSPEVDFRYRIFNADGGEVEQCGNGARCFVRFVRDKGLTAKREIRVETLSGVIAPRLEDDGRVTVDMGPPAFEPARVPFDTTGLTPLRDLPAASPLAAGARALDIWPLDVYGRTAHVIVVSMGNPHAIQVVPDVDLAPVATQGPLIEGHPRFPAAGERRLHARGRPASHRAPRPRARRGRDARLRHRRVRGGRRRHPARAPRLAGRGRDARRGIDDRLARRGQSGVHDRTGGDGVRGRDRD